MKAPSPAAVLWWAVVTVLTVCAVWQLPGEARQLRSDVEAGSRDRVYRELQPARSVGLDDRLFRAAPRIVPQDASFDVVTGPDAGITDPLVLRWARRFARYQLLPRRLVSAPARADWILSYGRRIPARNRGRVHDVAPGLVVAEVDVP